LPRAFEAAEFSGKFGAAVDVLAPQGIGLDRLVAIGAGKVSALDEHAWLRLGGTIAAALRNAAEATVVLDFPASPPAVRKPRLSRPASCCAATPSRSTRPGRTPTASRRRRSRPRFPSRPRTRLARESDSPTRRR